jgi:hypothetical protein
MEARNGRRGEGAGAVWPAPASSQQAWVDGAPQRKIGVAGWLPGRPGAQ